MPKSAQLALKPPGPALRISPEVAAQLREMQQVAAKVNGSTPADDPARRVSEELSVALDALVHQGASISEISRAVGVGRNAVTNRLTRHGYRRPALAQEDDRYKGRPRKLQAECKYGHPLFGENLYVVPRTGIRVCRACDRRRTRVYQAKKRAALAD